VTKSLLTKARLSEEPEWLIRENEMKVERRRTIE
jgi:hypothetical protein